MHCASSSAILNSSSLMLSSLGDDKVVLKCNAMLQKEVPDVGLVDEECGEEVKEEHAGLCV